MTSKINESKNKCQNAEENIMNLIPDLRNILFEKHNLDIPERNNDFLARCLRMKDGNLEKAVKLALAFPKLCSELLSWKISLQPSCYKTSYYDSFNIFPLAVRDSENRRIFIIQMSKWDTNTTSCNEALLADGLLLIHAASQNLEDQRNGLILIWDFKGTSMNHIYALKHRCLLTMMRCAQNGVIGRIKGSHSINHPKPVSLVYSGLKPFVKNKLIQRIHFHDNLSSLTSWLDLDPKYLPKIFGGDREVEECIDKQFMHDLVNSDAFFQDMFEHGFPTKQKCITVHQSLRHFVFDMFTLMF